LHALPETCRLPSGVEEKMTDSVQKKILVIDDDEAIRECIAYFLEEEGHHVTLCSDGFEGLRLFAERKFDLVVTDIMMPGKDGLGTIIEMEKADPSVAILAISGVDMKETLLDAAEIFGALHTLKKPFTREQLIWSVNNSIDSMRLPLLQN
jgi:DNA-binding response OmpR family regulator